ncbi:hypothetical protein AZI85_15170 [Bdellovibrio bacteriovorus]|uniref:Uncharacterized protein n=1 Tax=Bdellovibrio bacteriovorus TaxID=959 RepID=A0A150WUC7_BDEBC|nr:hypothetical protein [Bdellovibrio bacteriovorus]KYG70031.1 hypothetical protein AZI85_15170 [Bdellovibrio bacteriovorus]
MAGVMTQVPRAERQRILEHIDFKEGQVLSRDLPKDTVLKHLILRLSGAVQTTYASGTPIANAESTFDSIISRIDVKINGGTTVKSVRPHLMHVQQLFSTLIQAERKAQAKAAAGIIPNPTTEGGFVYGTTGQFTEVAETVLVSFQNVYAKRYNHTQFGPESTWLNLKQVSSATVELSCGNFKSLQNEATSSVAVTYGPANHTFKVHIQTVEAQDVPANFNFTIWKQTTREVTFSGPVTDYAIDINKGNRLQGIMLFAKDGSNNKLASNLLIKDVALVLNGQTTIKKSRFLDLQADNRSRFGVDAKFAGGVSRLDGVAYLDFLQDGDISSALEVMQPLVDNVQLVLSLHGNGDVPNLFDTGKSASITIETQELILPR